MVEEVKILLGDRAGNYQDALIELYLKQAISEIESYTNRTLDSDLEIIAEQIAIIKLNRINSEGLTSQSYSGISETYTDGYPKEIMSVLNRKRKIKTL